MTFDRLLAIVGVTLGVPGFFLVVFGTPSATAIILFTVGGTAAGAAYVNQWYSDSGWGG